jgi:hypothetical protein
LARTKADIYKFRHRHGSLQDTHVYIHARQAHAHQVRHVYARRRTLRSELGPSAIRPHVCTHVSHVCTECVPQCINESGGERTRYMIPSRAIRSFRVGTLNLHPSLLPKYRGAAPIQHALLNGDTATACHCLYLSLQHNAAALICSQFIKLHQSSSEACGSQTQTHLDASTVSFYPATRAIVLSLVLSDGIVHSPVLSDGIGSEQGFATRWF